MMGRFGDRMRARFNTSDDNVQAGDFSVKDEGAESLSHVTMESSRPPQLNGDFFRITVIEEGYFLEISEKDDGSLAFSGFLIDMLRALAREDRANFTYELLTPSGLGSSCVPQGVLDAKKTQTLPYAATYRSQYKCGANDVNDLNSNSSTSTFSTDMYWGMYYVTADRLLQNQFTIPFVPPNHGRLAMWGTATEIQSIEELVEQQKMGKQPPVCIPGSTSVVDYVQSSFPDIEINPVFGSDMYPYLESGVCEVAIWDAPLAAQSVLRLSESGKCLANGKPVGVIGEPMAYGLTHYAIGVKQDIPENAVNTLSYWMNVLMVCNPLDPEGLCPEGNLFDMYQGQGGTGAECNYVLFPAQGDSLLPDGAIIGIVMGAVITIVVFFLTWHRRKLIQQEKRFRERFVQQIARNIAIGPSPGDIAPGKLSEQILHIGGGKETINKADLSAWMHDIKMNFISQRDFDALWDAIDIDGSGEVDPVEFVVFLSACGREFEKVYNDQRNLPKPERLKLAARRLENLTDFGEAGVRRLENKMDKNSRAFALADRDDSCSQWCRGSGSGITQSASYESVELGACRQQPHAPRRKCISRIEPALCQ